MAAVMAAYMRKLSWRRGGAGVAKIACSEMKICHERNGGNNGESISKWRSSTRAAMAISMAAA